MRHVDRLHTLVLEDLKSPPTTMLGMLDADCNLGEPSQLLPIIKALQGQGSRFDALTANNLGNYRDMWALRSAPLAPL